LKMISAGFKNRSKTGEAVSNSFEKMPQVITTNKKNGKQQTLKFQNKENLIIGRLDTNDIPLLGKTVSRKHAEITRKVNDYLLMDLESGNGTYLNGKKLKPHERQVLHDSDVIRIEEFEIRFFLESAGESTFPKEERTDSDIIEIKMIKKVLNAIHTENNPTLEVATPPFEGQKAVFTDKLKELVIGRDNTCQLILDTPTISRRHVVLQKKWGGVTLTDLGSKNGTLVNGEKVKEKLLKDGDVLLLGAIKILFKNPQEINLEDLSKEYEKESENIQQKAPEKAEPISKEAKLSVEPEEIEEKEEKISKKKIPEIPLKIVQSLQGFSIMEKTLLGVGVTILIGALLSLFWILF